MEKPTDIVPISAMADGITNWLLEQGLGESTLEEIVRGLGQKLAARGIPVSRLSVGSMLLHPIFGAMDVVWRASSDEVASEMVPRSFLSNPGFQDTPFFVSARDSIPARRHRIEDPSETTFPMFAKMRDEGVTEYVVFMRDYGRGNKIEWVTVQLTGLEGGLVAFSTERPGGFSDGEYAYLESLTSVLALVIKTKTTQLLANTVIDTYLGAYSGDQVLRGSIARGDGRPIDCVVWYCDLRGSTEMAEQMELRDYLDILDDYFDCTAGAVLDHGGEVLKFIGDAVMAIFPVDAAERPLVDMCQAALDTANEAMARAARSNEKRRGDGQPEFRFGIAMHIGDVMYGNVGTEKRLDFTVIGRAVNQVTRLEGLCKRLGKPVIASAEFAQACPVDLVSLGDHEVAGRADRLAAYALPGLAY